jgi:hypothetical protein
MTEAQAQTAYSTALAQSQQNTGAALAGQAQTGLANPNYAQGIGNALQAGGFTYGMLANQNQNQNNNQGQAFNNLNPYQQQYAFGNAMNPQQIQATNASNLATQQS